VTGSRAVRAAVAVALLLAAAACGSVRAATTTRLYAYPGNPLFAAARLLQGNGHRAEAAMVRALAQVPSGIWAAGQPGEMPEIRQVTRQAARAHAIPVIIAYNLPGRDACGKYSATGPITPSGYESWIRQLAAAIGPGDDIIIVEPDGLPDLARGCLPAAQARERYKLLRFAMRRLSALPRARVYLDAGNPGLFPDPARLVQPLEQAGIRYGRGFSANVSNFQWTSAVVTWSQRLERALGARLGAVIDTSRNGRGPYTGPDTPQWCNPPGRAPGPAPRLDPGARGIDAYLWIKNPGASDGPCNGGPPAGQYWLSYAIALERASHPS